MKSNPTLFLANAVRLLEPVLDQFAPKPAPGRPYASRTLLHGAGWTLSMCEWRPNIFTAPHDHAGAAGLVALLAGKFRERRYRFDRGELLVDADRILEAPTEVVIEADDIHDMSALGDGPARSLHLYQGGGDTFEIFDLESRMQLTMPEGGAWLPSDPAEIVDLLDW